MDAARLRYFPAQGRVHLKLATAKVERTPNAVMVTAAKGGSGRPNAAATSTTVPPSDQRVIPAP